MICHRYQVLHFNLILLCTIGSPSFDVLSIWLLSFQQRGEAPGVCKYNVLIHLVDHRFLLGVCRWPNYGSWCSSALLVCADTSNPYQIKLWQKNKRKKSNALMLCDAQAFHNLLGIRCVLCGLLCCSGLCHWNCCVLLPSLYHCHIVCCDRPGMSFKHLSPGTLILLETKHMLPHASEMATVGSVYLFCLRDIIFG